MVRKEVRKEVSYTMFEGTLTSFSALHVQNVSEKTAEEGKRGRGTKSEVQENVACKLLEGSFLKGGKKE